MSEVKGYVKHIVFRNAENGYTVLTLVSDGEELTCVGTLPVIDAGDMIEAEGSFTRHAVYGAQFKVSSCRVLQPTDAAQTERYLASGAVKGIGEALAARIVKRFGDDTFRIMEEEPERLAEVKGISLKKAREIALVMQEKRDSRDMMVFLQRFGISGTLAARIIRRYGEEVYTVLGTNPYRLADDIEGIGFKTADEIALKSGMTADAAFRVRGGLLYALVRAAQDGNCYLPGDELVRRARELLGIEEERGDLFENELLQLQLESRIICITPEEEERAHIAVTDARTRVYDASLYRMERESAMLLLRVADAVTQETGGKALRTLEEELRRLADLSGITADTEQQRAVRESVTKGVVIITGGPGTGKTTTINTILRYYEKRGMEVLLGAPTGRAAKRMSEATGYEAKTIHRLLEVNGQPDEGGMVHPRFERNELTPLEADCVIIDEMSMVDIRLFHALLKAVSPGTRLILVGDASQLPSVGPGQVLRDLIESRAFPTIVLQKIFRQEEASDIVLNAHRIHAGERIALDNHAKDFFFLKRDDVRQITNHIVELVRDRLPPYLHVDFRQIQVLTPMKKGELGTLALNKALQSRLNPPKPFLDEHDFGDRILRVGDKVMQVKNNYQAEWELRTPSGLLTERGTGVFNGDLGIIREINESLTTLTVEFDEGRCVTYPFSLVSELELAYVVTIHKSQGSEYPAVVMPLLGGPRLLMNRNLLYTGVTRAKSLVVMLGSEETVYRMIDNTEQVVRYAGLGEQIANLRDTLF